MEKDLPNFKELLNIINKLRGNEGCPWDQKQTNKSLSKYLREESQELLEAIAKEDSLEICEELGDLLFVIMLLCKINEEQKKFTLNDMLLTIKDKLIRRHPHVFAGKAVGDEESLRKQWLEIKAKEKK